MDIESRRTLWKERVEDFKSSGLSIKKWCELNNIKYYQMLYWIKKYNQSSLTSINWLPVKVSDYQTVTNNSIRIKVGSIEI